MAWGTKLGLPLSFLCATFVRILQIFYLSLRDSDVLAVEVRNDSAMAQFRCWGVNPRKSRSTYPDDIFGTHRRLTRR